MASEGMDAPAHTDTKQWLSSAILVEYDLGSSQSDI